LACHVVQPLVNLPALRSKNKDHVAAALTKLAARNIPLLEQAGDGMRELVRQRSEFSNVLTTIETELDAILKKL
jgi:hypothetical protein